jgi:outer membrane lipoprotein LolB
MSRAVPALAAAALLAACAHVAVRQNDGLSFAERRARLEAITSWQMRGRLAVSTGERGYQANYRWRQDGDRLDVSVRGFLGAGAVEVRGSPAELTVTARGEQRVLRDPEAQLSELLGWWMPVESLRYWLLGLPDPAFQGELDFGQATTLQTLDQRLWHVAYESYQLSDGMLVPRRIDMRHDALELRLTVDAFEPAEGGASALN